MCVCVFYFLRYPGGGGNFQRHFLVSYSNIWIRFEIKEWDPGDPDAIPSKCPASGSVQDRFRIASGSPGSFP